MKRFLICVAAVPLAACHEKTPVADSNRAAPAVAQAAPLSAPQADSARRFVQAFYDWYIATEERKGSTYDSLLTSRRAILSDSLYRALRADIEMQRADTVAEIASLSAETDLFLNSQDPCPRYTARSPRAMAGDQIAVIVAGDCSGLDTHPNIEVYLRRHGTSWQTENIRDPTSPSYDLLGALARYQAATDVRK